MFVPFLCVVIAAFLPYVVSMLVVTERISQFGGLNNKYPRLEQPKLEGIGARALAAEFNGFEAFPVFAAAVLMAAFVGLDPAVLGRWCMIYIAMRTLHAVFYLVNWDKLRTLAFFGGMACVTWIFVLVLRAVG